MKLGKNKYLLLIIALIFSFTYLSAEEKISTVPLVNLEKLKPSYEEEENNELNENTNIQDSYIKEKNKTITKSRDVSINIIGLDKITAKTTQLNIKVGEIKKFGFLEIKAIRCGKLQSVKQQGEAAYIQIKDLSASNNEKVFVFNGWTFSSSKALQPIDHPIYDIWLVSCENV